METKTATTQLDPTMSKWCLSVVNADPRSAFEFVHVSGFRAPTSDEAQRAWLNLTKLEYGLLMDISSLIPDTSLACKKLPAPDSEAALRPNDPYANREMARVAIGARELSLDEFLRQQRIVNNGARAASLVLFNAGMYIYRHLNAYNKATRPFQPQSFENEFAMFCNFADTYSAQNTRIEIYGQTTAPATILRQIAFVCWGCRRHCTTFGLAASNVVHWCGGVVCELAGPLSAACMPPPQQQQPVFEMRTAAGHPVNLVRGHGSTDTIVRLTRSTNADESLRLWCAVVGGELVPHGLADVWLPSATAWRFRIAWDTDYTDVMNWPPKTRTTAWQPMPRAAVSDPGAAATDKLARDRCRRLQQRTKESHALFSVAAAAAAATTTSDVDINACLARTFPWLARDATPVATLARLICYFQLNSKRMTRSTRKVFIDLFLKTKTASIAAREPEQDPSAAHGDALAKCCCSKLPSFLTTLSNRVRVASVVATQRKRNWPGASFVDTATERWWRRWPRGEFEGARTRIQDLKVHIANLNVSMTSTDATNVQKQTEGTRVLAELMGTPLPYAPLDLVLRNRSCPTPIEELLMLAGWTGVMSNDAARMLVAAGIALFFAAILELRGPFSELQANRALGGDDVKWQPAASEIVHAIQRLAPGTQSRVDIDPDTCALMCAYLETKWPAIFEDQRATPLEPKALANIVMQELAHWEPDPAPVAWSRTPTPSSMLAITDLGSAPPLMVDVRHIPDGLPSSNVQLCLELVATGRRLMDSTAGVNFSPSLRYASLEPFHRSGLDPANVDEAMWMVRTEVEARNNDPSLSSPATTAVVDVGDSDAFIGPNSGFTMTGFVFDSDHERSLARLPSDFRITAQRVRQHEFVRSYTRLVAQCASGGDDVTVMMNMAARLDRMWRRDFPAHGIVGMQTKIELRSHWQARFGGDAQRATKDVAAVMELGSGAAPPKALGVVRAASNGGDAQYMNIDYKWPASLSPPLRRLRHELEIFAYNRRVLPFAMERLALDIVVVEACCVDVLDALDSQHAWAIVCFAMFTVFDLRPIFMSTALPQRPPASTSQTPTQTQLQMKLDARRNSTHKT